MKQVDFASFWVNIKFVFNKIWHAYLTYCICCWIILISFSVFAFSCAPLFSTRISPIVRCWRSGIGTVSMEIVSLSGTHVWMAYPHMLRKTSNMYKQTNIEPSHIRPSPLPKAEWKCGKRFRMLTNDQRWQSHTEARFGWNDYQIRLIVCSIRFRWHFNYDSFGAYPSKCIRLWRLFS